tara:strand:- start:600 stop:881 length:282 start_codon:yes stop_codon:yes gene_type:complete
MLCYKKIIDRGIKVGGKVFNVTSVLLKYVRIIVYAPHTLHIRLSCESWQGALRKATGHALSAWVGLDIGGEHCSTQETAMRTQLNEMFELNQI